ncbi:MAG: metallophosphoesterase [Kiritimatiellia bacterium]
MTQAERRRIRGRMGARLYRQRILLEGTRELKLGGRVRICPMRLFKPLLTFGMKAVGLWRRGRREFLSPVVRHNTFVVPDLPPAFEGFTVLHLSDLHLDLDTQLTPILAQALQGLDYDIAVVTGDFNNFTVHMDDTALKEMAKLAAVFTAPLYGVLGNHDSLRDIPTLERIGVKILLNESVLISRGDAVLRLVGIDDPNIFATHDLDRALASPGRRADVTVLLSHAPCIHREAAARGVDIVLCGHTHGGQICLPNGSTLRLHKDGGARHVQKGAWRDGSTQGWTSSGTGACGIPVRINCPPEILLHRLAATENGGSE